MAGSRVTGLKQRLAAGERIVGTFVKTPSPIVVVLSGSMEPAFQRGDLLFLWNRAMDTQVGEIVVYNVRGKDIPIVHRVIRRFGGGWVNQTTQDAILKDAQACANTRL